MPGDGAAEPSRSGGPASGTVGGETTDGQWPLWEVFTQAGRGAPHQHAGSVHATDAEHAMQNARDVYTRRGEAVSLWVVPADAIVASAPGDAGPMFDPGNDKPYRHPHFYKVPLGVKVF